MKDLILPPGDWAPCPDAPDLFMVSRKGELFSLRSKRIVSQSRSGNGYVSHVTKVGGRKGKNLVLKPHIQVAKAFHPNPENKPEVNHKNGIKTCNEDWNVEWATRQENVDHSIENNLRKSNGLKLSGPEIRELLESPIGNVRECAEALNVHHTTVVKIRNNPAHYLLMTMTKK
ncbi:hypothetical protein pEaSNUABM6_00017 [Erwinia phage pEa_SNUABM_6]|nr:hypothetical protein pEaSNUABM6_00017 [Erwinia phage pEa_SNUABM_6]